MSPALFLSAKREIMFWRMIQKLETISLERSVAHIAMILQEKDIAMWEQQLGKVKYLGIDSQFRPKIY